MFYVIFDNATMWPLYVQFYDNTYIMSLYDDLDNDFYVDEIPWGYDDAYVVLRALMYSLC